MTATIDATSNLTCRFDLQGVKVECFITANAVVKWAHVLAPDDLRQVKRLAEQIAGAHLRRSAAQTGESWVVRIERATATCSRTAD